MSDEAQKTEVAVECRATEASKMSASEEVKDAQETPQQETADVQPPMAPIVAKGLFGGLLMGLANLVPGISGGTMLLASGVYQHFVDAIAELTHLKFRLRSLIILGAIAVMAAVAILLFAGPVKSLVVEHRWVMYSLFIGLTLGGVPVLKKLIGKSNPQVWIGAVCGLVVMILIAILQMRGAGESGAGDIPWAMFLLGGVLGASAMVLPGISGGYLLLLLGQYIPLLGAIDAFKNGLLSGQISTAIPPAIHVLLPVGLGVLGGIAFVSNLLKFLFAKFEKPTLGVLMGFLVGAVVGLWPFQEGVRPAIGFVFKGKHLTTEAEIDAIRANWPTEFFTPSILHVLGALALIAAGFFATILVDKIGESAGNKNSKSDSTSATLTEA